MSHDCAVCGGETDAPEKWGQRVCTDCRYLRVLRVARCERADCRWTTTEDGFEYNRGAAKQAIQRDANNHEKMKRIIEDEHGHNVETWETNHPGRERLLPVGDSADPSNVTVFDGFTAVKGPESFQEGER